MSSHRNQYFSFIIFAASYSRSLPNSFHKNKCGIVQQFNVYILYIFIFTTITAAQTISLNGFIVDAFTHQTIPNATIVLRETGERKKSDLNGYFQFSIRQKIPYAISAHHFAYSDAERVIASDFRSEDTITITLQPKIFQSDGIIVNSTRLSPEIGINPFPISILTSDDLIQKNSVTISDVLNTSPGVTMVRDGAWETAVSIRGMSRSNIVMLVDNSRIETANDIAGALSLFNTHDLERIETIRSSGGALYGTGALGGIVHLQSKRASFTDEIQMNGELNSDFSSVNNYTSQHLAIKSSSEQFASRVSGGFRNADNTKTPAGILPNSQFADFNVTGFFGIKTFGDQSLNLSYQRSQAENAGISGGSPIAATAKATYKLTRREFFGLEYLIPNISYAISSLAVRLSQQNISRNVEIIQTPALTLTPHAVHSTTSAQIESRISVWEGNFFVLGTDIWQRSLVSRREKINASNNTITGERPIPESRFLSAGLYGQNEWIIVPDKTTLIFGARYDWIHIANDETRNPEYIISNGILNSAPANQIILWKGNSVWNESWSGNMGIQYSFTKNTDANFLMSTAFRSPSLEERFQYLTLGDGIHVGNPNLKPERSIGVNAGLQWHTTESNMRMDVFHNTLTNLVTDAPGIFEGSAAFVKQNISEARLYGYEISGSQSFTSWAALNFSVSYVRGEDRRNNVNLSQIAPLHGNVELLVRNQDAGRIAMSLSISAPQEFLGAGEKRTPGYAVFDIDAVSIPITVNQFSIITRGGIKNILNKAYRNHLSTLRGTVISEPGRNFFLSLSITV